MRNYAAIVILITAVAVVFSTANSSHQDRVLISKPTIKIVADQTPSKDGPPKVEIIQPTFISTAGKSN